MAMRVKATALLKSLLWCLLIVVFPIASGTLSVVFSLDRTTTLFIQGLFMLAALVPPAVLVLTKRLDLGAIGFGKLNRTGCKKAYFFIPVLALFIPIAVKGFHVESSGYVLGCLFLYLSVAIAEEVYFRGLIPMSLQRAFHETGTISLSSLIFALGHMTAALSGLNILETVLTVANALIFGWMAIEIVILSNSILPAILFHFLFDLETKFATLNSYEMLIAELVRGTIMFLIALWLATVIGKDRAEQSR